MNHRRLILAASTVAAIVAGIALPATAAPSSGATSASLASSPATRRVAIRLEVGRTVSWVGQSIPITVKVQFREVDSVTLEGAPELKSEGVFTSDLVREPRQSTEVVRGEPVLVATWTGTITPSAAGPLALSVELPVRIRYHEAEAPPAFQDPTDMDPFAAMDVDPSDPTSIERLFRSFQQSFGHTLGRSTGRVHEETTTLKASSAAMDVKPLPAAEQPAVFSGAVGRFDVRASVDATQAKASEPVTLRITVKGEGDLDRVDMAGISTSPDWKAYPTTSKMDDTSPGKRAGRKTFEQVLIPLHGGNLTIPPVTLSSFDPVAGRYVTVETAPLTLTVEGPSTQAPLADPTTRPAAPIAAAAAPEMGTYEAPSPSSLVDAPRTLLLRLGPVFVALLAALWVRRWRRRPDEERSLRRVLHRTAKRGSAAPFFEAARRLIVVHFAKRWGVPEGAVTADSLRQHLGALAEPLVAAITSADAVRFGRRDLEPTDLGPVCSSIEESLRDAR